MKFSLVIPCYNEAKNIPLLLERCAKLVAQKPVEVILVDNGSSDDTPDVLRNLLPQYPGCKSVRVDVNQGYGFGILTGLRAASGDVIGWTHADMQTDPIDAVQGFSLFEQHGLNIFVKGKRYGRAWSDTFFTIGMSFFETLLLLMPLWDINAQPTLLSKSFFETWQNPPHDFSLDLYAYYQAKKAKFAVQRFPVYFGKRAHGVSSWNINWAAKFKFIKRTIAFSLRLRGSLHS
ncbi:MAG TPA: glycosyltransferase family 2 protein [Gammaproteobacteria bacterium]|nr:glycosyltransferase family 2 protein [Gammaproteobacteria bacterium]